MPMFKIKPMPLVAKVLSLRRKSVNSQQQQQKQTITQEGQSSQPSGDTSEPKKGIPPPKDAKLSESESNNDEARVNRRWEPYFLYINTVKMLLAVLVICALFGMIPLQRRKHKKPQDTGMKVIMLWNEDPSKISKGSEHMECGCVVTSRRKNYEMAIDAFVFNADRRYDMRYIPKMNRTLGFLSVFAARNPLSMAKVPPPLFNLTMTYRLDSQLVWSDFYFSLLNQAERVNSFRAPSAHYAVDMPVYEMQLLENKTRIKDRLAMYIMYEVDEASMAQSLYLEKLRKYASLEAYPSCLRDRLCIKYYFLLIFDPFACPDYVPTQMFEAMYKFVVPVLIGGGNLNNLVPPHSYISSHDYPNPKDLVAYLRYLVKTPAEYKRYFWWHSLYKLRRTSPPYCQLCYLLQQPQEDRRIETSFANWWTTNQCTEPMTTFL